MKEWAGAIIVFVIICGLAIGFFKVGLPYIQKSMTTLQSHSARL